MGTVGKIEALPGAINVIPGRARFSLDVRAPTDAQRERALGAIRGAFADIARRRRVRLDLSRCGKPRLPSARPGCRISCRGDRGRGPARAAGCPRAPGHDGMAMIAIADIGMLFVRCKGGVSHNPAEAITAADADAAARVLLRFIENFRPPR